MQGLGGYLHAMDTPHAKDFELGSEFQVWGETELSCAEAMQAMWLVGSCETS